MAMVSFARRFFCSGSRYPPGGVIRRLQGSNEPDGVLEETPHFIAFGTLLSALKAMTIWRPTSTLRKIRRGLSKLDNWQTW